MFERGEEMKKIALLAALILLFSFSFASSTIVVKHETITVDSPQDIMPLDTSKEAAYSIMYNVTPNLKLSKLPAAQRTQYFIYLMVPNIILAKNSISENRHFITSKEKSYIKGTISNKDKKRIDNLFLLFQVQNQDFSELKFRLVTPPVDLILAQAALESGWGTSRFFVQGNNAFGLHAFNDSTPSIQSIGNPNTQVMKFKTLEQCIEQYFITLSTNSNYDSFRNALNSPLSTNTPYLLSQLGAYSILGADLYSEMLLNVINQNTLSQYNNYVLIHHDIYYSYYFRKFLRWFTLLWIVGETY